MTDRLAALVATLMLTSAPPQQTALISGIGIAIDGDSLRVGDTEVRLFAIDAPEANQTCGRGAQQWACGAAASAHLMKLATGRQITCTSRGEDQYGRSLGQCVANGVDLNQAMVSAGYAVAYRRFGRDYVAAEEAAHARRLGLWQGEFQMPREFQHEGQAPTTQLNRATRHLTPKSARSSWRVRAQSKCAIKGNRNRRGEWIYHVPGMPYYERTRPEEIFCTEAEARAAGYRRAIVRP